MASWYGDAFHGRRTANGEVYDMRSFTAAHPTMPLPSYARVTNLANGYSIIVRVNDRGPYHGGRVMDVSSRVADVLDFKNAGTAKVKVDYVGPAPLEGSDDSTLLASLRTNGAPATIDGPPAMVAAAEEAPQPSSPSFLPSFVKPAAPPPPAPEPAAEPVLAASARQSQIVESAAAAAAPVRPGRDRPHDRHRSPRRRPFRRDGPFSRPWPAIGRSISPRATAPRLACCGATRSRG